MIHITAFLVLVVWLENFIFRVLIFTAHYRVWRQRVKLAYVICQIHELTDFISTTFNIKDNRRRLMPYSSHSLVTPIIQNNPHEPVPDSLKKSLTYCQHYKSGSIIPPPTYHKLWHLSCLNVDFSNLYQLSLSTLSKHSHTSSVCYCSLQYGDHPFVSVCITTS